MRSHNLTLVARRAWRDGEIIRAELVRELGMAPSTVSKLVGDLVETGLLVESHAAPSGGGRPPRVVRFAYDRATMLGLDIGASHVTAVCTDLAGTPLAVQSRPHPVRDDPQGTLRLAEALAREVVAEADTDVAACAGVGLAVPAPVLPAGPSPLSEAILPTWSGIDPGAALRRALGLPVWMENDANVCAAATVWLGVGRGHRSLVYLKLGTGIGAGIVVDGALLRGTSGFAGEVGHIPVDLNGPRCPCGLSGCLDVMAGSTATLARYHSQHGTSERSDLRAIAVAAREGDAAAQHAVRTSAKYLALGVASIINWVNPSMIVLGGSLTEAGDVLLEPLRAMATQRAEWAHIPIAKVRISEFGQHTTAIGAATLVLREVLNTPGLVNRTAVEGAA